MTFHSPTHKPNQTLEAYIRAQRANEKVALCRANLDAAIRRYAMVCALGSTHKRGRACDKLRASRCAYMAALSDSLKGAGE